MEYAKKLNQIIQQEKFPSIACFSSMSMQERLKVYNQYKEGKYHGRGKFTWANGHVMLTKYDADRPVGQGVGWTADRTQAVELLDGTPGRTIRLDEAEAIAARIGLAVPERGMPLCFFGA